LTTAGGYRTHAPAAKAGAAVNDERPATDLEHVAGEGFEQWSGPDLTIIQSTKGPEPRQGIYLKGACDLPALLHVGDLLREEVHGSVAIARGAGGIANARADILLQTLDDIPADDTRDVIEHLELNQDYFQPVLFEPTFRVGGPAGAEFPKKVVVLSLVPNIIRSVYRHREHGFLVDPGALWLNRVDEAMGDQAKFEWIREHFTSVGRLTLDEFTSLFTRLVTVVKEKTGAHLLVTNVLTVEPGDRTHSFQLRKAPQSLRRRQFCIRLAELSRELDFHIVDVDRVLKRHGITRQLNFAHFPLELGPPIAEEALRILRELEVV
jgi:hypothetical protein